MTGSAWRNGAFQGREKVRDIYRYERMDGSLAFEIVRKEPKSFYARRRDSRGNTEAGLAGTRRIPYRLPRIMKQAEHGRLILVVEGEGKVHALEAIGYCATTAPFGARGWLPQFGRHFTGADVVVLPDNDIAGKEYARQVASSVSPYAKSIRLLELPGLSEREDVVDWLRSGGTREQLGTLIASSQPCQVS